VPIGRFEQTALRRAVGVDKHSGSPTERDPATADALALAGWLSGGAQGWLGGQGRAEADLGRSYGLPVEYDRHNDERRGVPVKQARSTRVEPDATGEAAGPTYNIISNLPEQYRHAGDAAARLIIPGAPRALPVTQAVSHGPEPSRSETFDEAAERLAGDLPTLHSTAGFIDRRLFGRKHRPGGLFDAESYCPYPKDQEPDWSRGY
jgi:hypothetical protein